MRSFKRVVDNRHQVYLALVGSIESQLRDAYAKRHEECGETQSSLARKLGIGRSAVHNRLTGRHNMTIKTLADMVWALGHCIKIDIFDPEEVKTNHPHLIPDHPAPSFRIENPKEVSSSSNAKVAKLKFDNYA